MILNVHMQIFFRNILINFYSVVNVILKKEKTLLYRVSLSYIIFWKFDQELRHSKIVLTCFHF